MQKFVQEFVQRSDQIAEQNTVRAAELHLMCCLAMHAQRTVFVTLASCNKQLLLIQNEHLPIID